MASPSTFRRDGGRRLRGRNSKEVDTTFDTISAIVVIVIAFTVGAYLGALMAIVRPDHRNPVTRPLTDWIERHAGTNT